MAEVSRAAYYTGAPCLSRTCREPPIARPCRRR